MSDWGLVDEKKGNCRLLKLSVLEAVEVMLCNIWLKKESTEQSFICINTDKQALDKNEALKLS